MNATTYDKLFDRCRESKSGKTEYRNRLYIVIDGKLWYLTAEDRILCDRGIHDIIPWKEVKIGK